MKTQHVILCDAGCYEVGNELPEEWQVLLAADEARAERLFKEACRHCRQHVQDQREWIESDPDLELTSDYYWTVLWLRLPVASEVDSRTVYAEISRRIGEDVELASLVARFDGEGKDLSDALDDLESMLGDD